MGHSNGRVAITVTNTDAGVQFAYEWQDGNTIEISHDLLRCAYDGIFEFEDDPMRVGGYFTMGPYRLQIIEIKDHSILAKRVEVSGDG